MPSCDKVTNLNQFDEIPRLGVSWRPRISLPNVPFLKRSGKVGAIGMLFVQVTNTSPLNRAWNINSGVSHVVPALGLLRILLAGSILQTSSL